MIFRRSVQFASFLCVFHLRLLTQICGERGEAASILRGSLVCPCLSCFVAFRLSEREVFEHGLRTDKRWSVRLQALGLHLNACIVKVQND